MQLPGLNKLLILLLISWSGLISAQSRFFTEIDSREVVANETFQVRFTVENGQPVNFRPPDWNGLDVVKGPSRSMHSTFINGQMSTQTSFIYLVSAPKPGKYSIGPATVEIDRRKWSTDPVSVSAKTPDKVALKSEDLGKPYFIAAVLDTNEAYIGQQILLEYKLFTRVEINSYDIIKAPDFQGAYYINLPILQRRARREVVNGIEYTSQLLRRVAVFPQQSGKLVIDPMYFQLGIVDREERRSFFFSSRIRPVKVTAEAVELNVKRIPDPVPDNYAGVVGYLAMSTRWDRSRASVNDGISLKLTLSTDSDPKQVVAPDLDFGADFEVYPPNLISEETNQTSGRALVTKTWEYVLVPQNAGQYTLDFELAYYDPDSSGYQTISSSPWKVTIVPGAYTPGKKVDEEEISKIHPPDLLSEHNPIKKLWWGNLGYWVLFTLPLLTGIIFMRLHSIKTREAGTPLLEKNYKKARSHAQSLMAQAKEAIKDEDPHRFYRSATEAFLGYAAHRLKVSPNNVTRQDMKNYLSNAGIQTETIDRFIGFWDRLDMAQYAPSMINISREEIYSQAVELMSELEAALEKV